MNVRHFVQLIGRIHGTACTLAGMKENGRRAWDELANELERAALYCRLRAGTPIVGSHWVHPMHGEGEVIADPNESKLGVCVRFPPKRKGGRYQTYRFSVGHFGPKREGAVLLVPAASH